MGFEGKAKQNPPAPPGGDQAAWQNLPCYSTVSLRSSSLSNSSSSLCSSFSSNSPLSIAVSLSSSSSPLSIAAVLLAAAKECLLPASPFRRFPPRLKTQLVTTTDPCNPILAYPAFWPGQLGSLAWLAWQPGLVSLGAWPGQPGSLAWPAWQPKPSLANPAA